MPPARLSMLCSEFGIFATLVMGKQVLRFSLFGLEVGAVTSCLAVSIFSRALNICGLRRADQGGAAADAAQAPDAAVQRDNDGGGARSGGAVAAAAGAAGRRRGRRGTAVADSRDRAVQGRGRASR